MSKKVRQLFDQLKDERAGGENLLAGLSWDKFFGDLKAEMKQQLAHGSHELAAGLFREHAGFVMYPRQEGVEQTPGHGVHGPEMNQPEQERGGREE
jgi:hypothetical protein